MPRYEDCVSDSSTDSNASSRGSDQAWEVDSFDDESEYQPQERMCPIEEEVQRMRLYRPKMYPSKVIDTSFYDKINHSEKNYTTFMDPEGTIVFRVSTWMEKPTVGKQSFLSG